MQAGTNVSLATHRKRGSEREDVSSEISEARNAGDDEDAQAIGAVRLGRAGGLQASRMSDIPTCSNVSVERPSLSCCHVTTTGLVAVASGCCSVTIFRQRVMRRATLVWVASDTCTISCGVTNEE